MKASYLISGVLLCATLGLAPMAVACDGHSKGAAPKAESKAAETSKIAAGDCCESKAGASKEDCCKDSAKADCCDGADKKASESDTKAVADNTAEDTKKAAGDATETKTEATGSDTKAAGDAKAAGTDAAADDSKSDAAAGDSGSAKTE